MAIFPFFSDAADGAEGGAALDVDLAIEEHTRVQDPATGEEVPLAELKSANPKLASSLNQLLNAHRTGGSRALEAFATDRSMQLEDQFIRVVIEVDADPHQPLAEKTLEDLKERIIQIGGTFELDFHNLVQVLLPVPHLREAGSWPEVKFVREPFFQSESVLSEGGSLVGSDRWQGAGHTGKGVKIAVIDVGFQNYDGLLGQELPPSVTTRFYGIGDDIYGSVHGTACAEIIHDMAPDAQLFLTQPRTELELWDAVNWCINQGVQVISHSVTYIITAGPLDGTGYINDIVNYAMRQGILWVNAAGNKAQSHWSGDFHDPDGDGWLNFNATDEFNDFETGGQKVTIGMIWDDPWGSSISDYDLYVYRLDDFTVVAYSTDIQDGDDDPSESVAFIPQPWIPYGLAIRKNSGTSKTIHVNILSSNPFEYRVATTSIGIPADNPNAVTVGAVAWTSPSILEDFSSQGPTTDGRIKPDLVAPDRVSVSDLTYGTYRTTGGFAGTSASCPHVAGACAQVLQAEPRWGPDEVKRLLESRATDQGISGKDNRFGSGLIHLGAPDPPFYQTLNFPHIASGREWETEIALVNTSVNQDLNGTLKAYNDLGEEVPSRRIITLTPQARIELRIGAAFANASEIGYIVFETVADHAVGYTKFFIDGQYRVAVPAVSQVNSGDIYLSHVASTLDWWTGISLVNTTSATKALTIAFDNGETKSKTLTAYEHSAFTIRDLFGGQPQPSILSAVIKNGSGVVGLELFGSTVASANNYLSGILLKDDLATRMYYPHIASDFKWWTGVVAYNPSTFPCAITITSYRADGAALPPQNHTIDGMGKYIQTVADLNLPLGTAWFQIEATSPISGFELFGTRDGNQLGGYTAVGTNRTEGIFAKLERDGWTGIAFVNIESITTTVTLTAYDDNGHPVAQERIRLSPHEKVVDLAAGIFTQDISGATYIAYASDSEIAGFQLNGSSDDRMLDGLPGM